jgi:hypothetical protein
MVLNNSKTTAYALFLEGTVPSSMEHAAITASEVADATLQIADQEDQQAIDQVVHEWNAAKLRHRLAKASAKRIRRRINNRNAAVLQADLCLREARAVLEEGLARNFGVIKRFLKRTKAKSWSYDNVDSGGIRHRRWLLVPSVMLIVDVIAHPELSTCAACCNHILVSSTIHATGASIYRLALAGFLTKETVGTIVRTRIHPAFAALLVVKPVFPAEPEPSDDDDKTSGSEDDLISDTGATSSSNDSSTSGSSDSDVPDLAAEANDDSSSGSDEDTVH